MPKNFTDLSRDNWHSTSGPVTNEQITLGCLQRIADATEKMAKNFTQLQQDRDMYKEWWEQRKRQCAKLQRQVNAYKGMVSKLTKKPKLQKQ